MLGWSYTRLCIARSTYYNFRCRDVKMHRPSCCTKKVLSSKPSSHRAMDNANHACVWADEWSVFDCSKAIHPVNHCSLCVELQAFGVECIQSFIAQRLLRYCDYDCSSLSFSASSSVLSESVLGPPLCLFSVNYLSDLPGRKIILFADDWR